VEKLKSSSIPPASSPQTAALSCLLWFAGFLVLIPGSSINTTQYFRGLLGIDGSWKLGIPGRLMFGELAGRDFLFTYGPLYQLLHGIGVFLPPHDPASLMRWEWPPEAFVVSIALWLLLRCTGLSLLGRAVAYLTWCVFCTPDNLNVTGVKPLLGMVLCAWCGASLFYAGGQTGSKLKRLVPWAVTVPVLVAYSFDSGSLTFVALLFLLGLGLLVAAGNRTESARQLRSRVAQSAGAMLAGLLLFLALCFAPPAWRHYLPDEWDLSYGYTLTMGYAIVPVLLQFLELSLLIVFTLTGFAAWRARKALQSPEGIPLGLAALIGALCYATFWCRTGFTRSDPPHVFLSVCPFLFLAGVYWPCYCWSRGNKYWSLGAAMFAIFLSGYILSPLGFRPEPIQKRLYNWSQFSFRDATIWASDDVAARCSLLNDAPTNSLYDWPFEMTVNLLTQRGTPNFTVQNYSAPSVHLQQVTVDHMREQPDMPVLFDAGAQMIDKVPHYVRSPVIFRYLLEQYQVEGAHSGKDWLLSGRPPGRQAKWVESPLVRGPLALNPAINRPLVVPLPKLAAPLRYSDLLGKPGILLVIFQCAGRPAYAVHALIPPDGREHEVLVGPRTESDPNFMSLFSPRRLPPSGPVLEGLALGWLPTDSLSTPPSEIDLDSASLLRRTGD